MSWRDRLLPGSFNKVPFNVERSTFRFGWRKNVHEYPLRDTPYVENNGKKAKRFDLELIVIGSDYMEQRDQLIKELEDVGKGELIHPYHGRLLVDVVGDCDCVESSRQGGMATITVPVVESGDKAYPSSQRDTLATTTAAISAAATSANAQFEKTFNVDSQPAFVAESAGNILADTLSSMQGLNSRLSALQTPFNQVAVQVDDIQTELSTLIRQPLQLASSLQALTITLLNTGNEVDIALSAYQELNTSFQPPAATPATPARQQEAANSQAIADLIGTQALLAVMQQVTSAASRPNASIAQSPFNSYQHAIAVRDALLAGIDAQLQTATDDNWLALKSVASSFMQHIERHGVVLQRIVSFSPKTTLPSLVLAHYLYGDASMESDIVSRNNLAHPGFISRQDLEVIDE